MHVGRRVRDAGCRCQPVERGMMPGMDGVRRGTRTRRLDEAAARASNGASHDDGPAAPPEDVDRAGLPGRRDPPLDRRRRREREVPRAARRRRPGLRRRRDGHDALRQRPAVRRSARGLEPRPPGRHPPDPARLHRRGLADPAHQHLRRQPGAAEAQRPRRLGRRAEPDRGDPAPRRGGRRGRARARRRRHRAVRRDRRAARDAALRGGGRHLPRAGRVAHRRRAWT